MTNPELPQPIPKPDFQQNFDGTQREMSELEKLDVAEAFSDYCDELLARNIEGVSAAQEPYEISRTTVNLVVPTKNGLLDVKVMKESHSAFTPYDIERSIPDAAIAVDHYDFDSYARSGFRYALRDSVVTREDVEDVYLEDMQVSAAGEKPLEGELLKKWLLEHAVEFDGMQSTESELGLNEQPISMHELNGLKEFLKDALPVRPVGPK